jgi:hypothetical protein
LLYYCFWIRSLVKLSYLVLRGNNLNGCRRWFRHWYQRRERLFRTDDRLRERGREGRKLTTTSSVRGSDQSTSTDKIITVSIASHLKISITRNISRRLPLLESTRETSITKCDWKDLDVHWLYSLLYNMLFTQFYGLTYLSDLSCMRHCRLRSPH